MNLKMFLLEASVYLGFKEGLGSFDPFCGNINFRETSKDTEATVL